MFEAAVTVIRDPRYSGSETLPQMLDKHGLAEKTKRVFANDEVATLTLSPEDKAKFKIKADGELVFDAAVRKTPGGRVLIVR